MKNTANHVLELPNIKYILKILIDDIELGIKIQNNYVQRHLSKEDCPEKLIDPKDHMKVTFSYLILALYKYMEFYDNYKGALNYFIKDGYPKKIYCELKTLQIKSFRDKYICHIIDNKIGGPIEWDKYDDFFNSIEKRHKSTYAFYLKLDTYDFIDYPLTKHLKDMLSLIECEIKKFTSS